MYYVIQQGLLKEYNLQNLVEYLERYGFGYEMVDFRPFGIPLDVKTERKDVWFFGSPGGAARAEEFGWIPGSLCNDNHDFEIYGKYYEGYMLNSDGVVINANEELPESVPYLFFARPTKDTKIFSGQEFTRDSWNTWIEEAKQNSSIGHITSESRVLLASSKDIQQEIRCWIVNGYVITMSQYRIGGRGKYLNVDGNKEAHDFAMDICKLFQPARAFVLDICLSEGEWKVVEINCINCSGFYHADMSKLIQALENEFKIS